jgi:phosphoglycolate phosphatase-like HAD superfamily hydrolase
MPTTKTALITDLDNTLFDWVDLWYKCFSAMLEEISKTSGVKRETLIPEIRAVHQKHGTSEYSFLIEELPSLRPMLGERKATEVFAAAIDAYRAQRREHLKLFPTVAETLLKIKGRGTRIIGYTESMGFYSNYRIRRLGLDGVRDYVFCPEDHVLPPGLTREQLRSYPASHYELRYTKQLFTPKGSKKPDTVVLNAIINHLGLDKSEVVYVGDDLTKDVAMAVDCEVDGAWAEYGKAHERPEYDFLREVTHWTPDEVERQRRIKAREHVHPTHTLATAFADVLDHFDFRDCHAEKPTLTDERKKQIIDVWKTIVGVQQHFNDIEMRIRSMFVTILLALFASIGFLTDKNIILPICSLKVKFAVIVPLIGMFGAYLFYFIDRYWYHRLLVGAVTHAITIERKYREEMPELSLSGAIGKQSPYKPEGWLVRSVASWVVKDPQYKNTGNLHSDAKIELFYKSVIAALGLAAFFIALLGGITR